MGLTVGTKYATISQMFGLSLQFLNSRGQLTKWSNYMDHFCNIFFNSLEFLVYGHDAENSCICFLQNKEKSVSLKTMEDGPVLLYSVSSHDFEKASIQHATESFCNLNFLAYRVQLMVRSQESHIHGWYSMKK